MHFIRVKFSIIRGDSTPLIKTHNDISVSIQLQRRQKLGFVINDVRVLEEHRYNGDVCRLIFYKIV